MVYRKASIKQGSGGLGMSNTTAITIQAEKVNVDLEMGEVILTGIDIDNIVSEFPVAEILNALDLKDIQEYLIEKQAEELE